MASIDQAIAHHQAGNLSAAESLYRRILEADRCDFDALHMLGLVHAQRGQFEQAEQLYCDALKVDATAALYHNYGNLLVKLNRLESAIECYDHALAIDPTFAPACSDRGRVEQELGHFDQALAGYAAALAIDPDYDDAVLNRSVCRLLQGDFERGWPEYERRWRISDQTAPRDFRQPLWIGRESVAGKTILFHAEQGLGDTIQFCRYAALVAAKGAKVILEVQPALKSLLANIEGAEHVLARGEPLPNFDFHCPLLSLPLAFDTRIDTIPARVPYLTPSVDAQKQWRARLGSKDTPRIGIAWSGSAENEHDRKRSTGLGRLLPLRALGLQLVSLQKEVRDEDREILNAHPDILHFGADFSDTAELISQMDLVISVDTSIVHLAGALGAPTWLLLAFVPDWRWLLQRDDSPWYPTLKLFRQPKKDDWESVIQSVMHKLKVWKQGQC